MTRRPLAQKTRGIPRSNFPLSIVRNDLANGLVPRDHLNELIASAPSSKPENASDLGECAYPKALSLLHTVTKSASSSQSIITTDRKVFTSLATEVLLCGLGTVAVFDLGMLPKSQARANAQGTRNSFVVDYLHSVTYLFIEAALSPVVTDYLKSNADAAHEVYMALKTFRYASPNKHIVLDCSAYHRTPTGDPKRKPLTQFAALIEQVYGYDTAHLLLNDSHTI